MKYALISPRVSSTIFCPFQQGEIWSHGGVASDSTIPPNETRITTLYKVQTCVPKLAELSWNLVLRSLSSRTDLLGDQSILTQIHIPVRFAQRIH